jgi:hypothetical protein
MSSRYIVAAIVAVINVAFVAPMVAVFVDTARQCSAAPYGCEGYNYFGAAFFLIIALGPGTAVALAAALIARWILNRRRGARLGISAFFAAVALYGVAVILTFAALGYLPWVTPFLMVLGFPALILYTTRPGRRPAFETRWN